jgi:hypothetical protein
VTLEEAQRTLYKELMGSKSSNWISLDGKQSVGLDGKFELTELKRLIQVMEKIDDGQGA